MIQLSLITLHVTLKNWNSIILTKPSKKWVKFVKINVMLKQQTRNYDKMTTNDNAKTQADTAQSIERSPVVQ